MKITFALSSLLFLGTACSQNLHYPKADSGNTDSTKTEVTDIFTPRYMNKYVLKAIQYLDSNYRLLGYNINGVLTHDIPYADQGVIPATLGGESMCVSAQMEVILTAMQIYAQEQNDDAVFDFLPKRSFQKLSIKDLKGHLWVNHEFNSFGGADALRNFGMGEKIPFEKLEPGAFVNINRVNRTGHAVVLISFVDINGKEYKSYNSKVVGFKYYSSQGKGKARSGLDYRLAIFEKFGCPSLPLPTDCGVIYSTNQTYLNTGMMLHPKHWKKSSSLRLQSLDETLYKDSVFNPEYFTGE